MNMYEECVKCTMEGCLNCSSADSCNYCQEGYYLTGTSCKRDMPESNYIFIQNQNGILIQLR